MRTATTAPARVGVGYRFRLLLERWAHERGVCATDGLRYWQEQTLDALLLAGVALGTVAWLPSVALSVHERLYAVALFDTFLLMAAVVLLLRRALPYALRAATMVTLCYLCGLVLLAVLGPFSAGPVWLFLAPVLAAVLGSPAAALAALAVNLIIMAAVAGLADFEMLAVPAGLENPHARWLVCCVNFLLLNTLATLAVSVVLKGLQLSLVNESRASASLLESNEALQRARDRMGEEVRHRGAAEEALQQHLHKLEHTIARRTADLESSNEQLRLFASSVSHDLRGPLRAIAGFGELLLEEHGDGLNAAARGYVERMRAGARQMDRLLDGMVRLSRSSRAEMHYETVDLSELAAAIVEDLRRREPRRAADIIVQPSLLVRGDRVLLEAALQNLLSNAWKFTAGRSTARIEVGACESANGGDGHPTYFVRDNGVGFDMLYVHKLFAAFQRLHAESEFPGTGIGLAIVRRVIERHGGRVWAHAEIDEGATFYFSLPADGEGTQAA